MPRSIDQGFTDFLQKLTPSSAESQASQTHRASISACLKNNFGLNRFVRIGSFGNATSVSGYSDVDYLASLPREQLTQVSTSTLAKVRNALDIRFPNTGVHVNCPAVAVPFGTARSETTEIVAADYMGDAYGYNIYDIADCAGGWMKASPDAHNAYVASIDGKLGNKVKRLIRFIKAWKYFRSVPISSFYLELRVAKYATGESAILYDVDVKRVLRMLADAQLANMQDPMGVSGYIAACKSDASKEDALSKLETAATRAENACGASGKGNITDAFDWWRLLYNNEFPSYYY
ncbi:MAG: nucleotidyltransferase [Chthoniobacterales bacterium]|nr:nucleotidyltransferase [Chthoniobacterales bacterium]